MLSFLVACNTNTGQETNKDQPSTQPSQISTSSLPEQSPSMQARKSMRKMDDIKGVYAVNTDKKLLVALELHQKDRFKLAKSGKTLSAKLKKQFPKMKTELSTDKKLIIELDKLEDKINQRNITKQKLEKEIKHLIKLMKEKT